MDTDCLPQENAWNASQSRADKNFPNSNALKALRKLAQGWLDEP
jgi:hypothetical protein